MGRPRPRPRFFSLYLSSESSAAPGRRHSATTAALRHPGARAALRALHSSPWVTRSERADFSGAVCGGLACGAVCGEVASLERWRAGLLERWHTSFSRRLRSLASSALSTAPPTQSTDARSRRVAITSAAVPDTAHFVMSVGSRRRAAACVGPVGGRLEGPAMRRLRKRTGCESTGRLRRGGDGVRARTSARTSACATRTRLRTSLPGARERACNETQGSQRGEGKRDFSRSV